jgi:hypothetical protein
MTFVLCFPNANGSGLGLPRLAFYNIKRDWWVPGPGTVPADRAAHIAPGPRFLVGRTTSPGQAVPGYIDLPNSGIPAPSSVLFLASN